MRIGFGRKLASNPSFRSPKATKRTPLMIACARARAT